MLAVIKREYITRVKTKGFIIGTLIFPVLIVLVLSGVIIFDAFFQPTTKTFAIVDESGKIYQEFINLQSDTLKNGEPKYRFFKVDISQEEEESIYDSLKTSVMNQKIEGYLIIPESILESREVTYAARNVSDFEELGSFSHSFSWIVTNLRLEQKGLDVDAVREQMNAGRVRLNSKQVTEEGEVEKSGISSYILTYFITYTIFLLIMIYGGMLMRSVIEEKSQRISETIVSSIKPFELMLGKLIGICSLGITQLIIFGIFIIGVVSFAEPIFVHFGASSSEFLDIIRNLQFSVSVFAFMIIFFILGFVFYSSLFAAVGAMVNSEDEGQQFQMPLIFLIIIGFFIMFTVARNPDTAKAFWISLIPFFTPLVMFARIAVSDPVLPSGAYLSIFTMLGFTAFILWIVAKIYRVGILMYGKKPSIKEALKWIRYK
jgi:ABC-2 type transport system permease protein